MIVIPSFGSDTEYEEVDIDSLELHILKNNLEIKRALQSIVIANFKLDEAEENQFSGALTLIESQKNLKYYIDEANMNVAYALWEYEEKKFEILLEGKKQYYSYLLLNEKINLQEQKVERLRKALEDSKTKASLGLATSASISSAGFTLDNETFILNGLYNDKEVLYLDLNVLMNWDMDTPLVLDEADIPFEVYVKDDLSKAIESAIKNNGELAKLDVEKSLIDIENTIYSSNNGSGEYDRMITGFNEDIINLSYDIRDLEQSIEYDVRSQYNQLLNLYDTVLIQELKVKNIGYDKLAASKRYEVGLTTEDLVKDLEEQLSFESLKLQEEKLKYYVAVEQFKNLVKE